jgi:hypothetical protein
MIANSGSAGSDGATQLICCRELGSTEFNFPLKANREGIGEYIFLFERTV